MEMENTTGVETEETTTEEVKKTYTEDEVADMVQRIADKRVTEALKKQEHKFSQKLAEHEKLKSMDAEQRKEYELEQKAAELDAQRREFLLMQNKLEASKVLSTRGLPVAFVDYVVAEDAETMMERITTFEKEFKAAVNDAVSLRIASPTPKSGATAQTGLTKESFMKLSSFEQQEIYRSNPELYKRLVS